MDGYVVLGSAVVGMLVGMTGAGGGALMTPMLVLLFSVKPSIAISSDLVAAVAMRLVTAVVADAAARAWGAAGAPSSIPTRAPAAAEAERPEEAGSVVVG